MTIFVDTSALYAILDRNDPSHPDAKRILESVAAGDERSATHAYVVVETLALTQRRLGRDAVRRMALDILPLMDVTWVGPDLHHRAMAALLAGRVGISLVDHVSFLVMRDQAIEDAFAFDDDFERAGFHIRR